MLQWLRMKRSTDGSSKGDLDVLAAQLGAHYGRRRLHIRANDDIGLKVQTILANDLGDFCWSLNFDEHFILELIRHGFLPICTTIAVMGQKDPLFVLLPKLHQKRCVVQNLAELRVDRGARKRSRKYRLSVNCAFAEVVQGCIEQHGESWLWPPIRDAFQSIFNRQQRELSLQLPASSSAGPAPAPLLADTPKGPGSNERSGPVEPQMQCVELWCEDRLVAGELGVSCGATYTSLTGFFKEDGCGTVQMLALAGLLLSAGFQCWDLGMNMDYKGALGAIDLDRKDFVALHMQLRTASPGVLPPTDVSAADLINHLVRARAALGPGSAEGS